MNSLGLGVGPLGDEPRSRCNVRGRHSSLPMGWLHSNRSWTIRQSLSHFIRWNDPSEPPPESEFLEHGNRAPTRSGEHTDLQTIPHVCRHPSRA
jgi:hypothetical protein